jgi:hypothetical protein
VKVAATGRVDFQDAVAVALLWTGIDWTFDFLFAKGIIWQRSESRVVV